jgi:hypothetical protein
MLVAAAALSAVMALPAVAATGPTRGKTHLITHTVKKSKHMRTAKRVGVPESQTTRAQPQPFSPFVHRPEYDVYVGGAYAGSDPDPRVRDTIKREYMCQSIMGC